MKVIYLKNMVKGYSHHHVKSSWMHYYFYWHTRKSKPLLKPIPSKDIFSPWKNLLEELEFIIKKIIKNLKCELKSLNIKENSITLGIKSDVRLSPHKIISRIKAVSSKELRKNYPELKKLPSLWTRSYFVSTYGKNIDIRRDMNKYDKFMKRQSKKKYSKKGKEK